MASNALSATNPLLALGGNMLAPMQQQPVQQQDPFAGYATPQSGLPTWLTDPTARGLGTDWAPAAHVDVADQVFTPRVIPPDAPPPAPFAAQAAPQVAAPNPAEAPPSPFGPGGGGGEGEGGGADGAGDGDAGGASGGESSGDSGGADANGGDGGGGDGGADGGGEGDGGGGDSGGDGGFFKGGIVTKNKLIGPNPHGPDDGFGPLNKGEGVLTAQAVKFYGRGMVAKLNKLMVPRDALR